MKAECADVLGLKARCSNDFDEDGKSEVGIMGLEQ